jgi:cell division protein ZapA
VRNVPLKNVAELEINGHRLVIKSDEGEEYIRAVESYLNQKIEEVKDNSTAVSTLDLTLLAALNITGEIIKTKETVERLGERTEELVLRIDRRMY